MPRDSKGKDHFRDFAASSANRPPPPSTMLASPARAAQTGLLRSHETRPALPSLSYLGTGAQFPTSPSSTSAASYSSAGGHVPLSHYTSPTIVQTSPSPGTSRHSPSSIPSRVGSTDFQSHAHAHAHAHAHGHGQGHGLFADAEPLHLSTRAQSQNPLRRSHETSDSAPALERPQYGTVPQPAATSTSDMSDFRRYPRSNSASNTSTPTTASHPAWPAPPPAFSSARSTSASSHSPLSRYKLHIRQQPRAARAGPDGKDRRPIDPPPILQLLVTDFNTSDAAEIEQLHSRYWVCHCRLVTADSPRRDMSTLAGTSEDGQTREIMRLLLGTSVASPFQTNDDPDPSTMPVHPVSDPADAMGPSAADPPSPSSRFFTRSSHPQSQSQSQSQPQPQPQPQTQPQSPYPSQSQPAPPPTSQPKHVHTPANPSTQPSTFFIFPDISIRRAGHYRLEFTLMFMDPLALSQTGSTVPVLSVVASSIFKVVNAKDFDQVKASTRLVRGLVERGAGFPLKLKKGTRGPAGMGSGNGNGNGSGDGEGEAEGGGIGRGARKRKASGMGMGTGMGIGEGEDDEGGGWDGGDGEDSE